jgi:peptide/nickel transport system ATP-binding protein
MNDEKSLLSVKNVIKKFRLGGFLIGTDFEAVSKISFELKKNKPEVYSIIGESGSGKTTLSRMILRLLLPNSGTISINGLNILSVKGRSAELEFMRQIQPIFQNPFESFNPLSRVDHFLYSTARNYFSENKNSGAKRIEESLNAVGLSISEVGGRYPHELSGGQLQRVSIARALIPKPQILIADEPVSMVDASLRMSIVNLFRDLKKHMGTSIIYITHDLATAYYISNRIAIMHRGIFVETGDAEKILLKPRHPYTRLLVKSVLDPRPSHKSISYNPSLFEKDEYMALGCKFASRCPLVKECCRTAEPPEINDGEGQVRCFEYK